MAPVAAAPVTAATPATVVINQPAPPPMAASGTVTGAVPGAAPTTAAPSPVAAAPVAAQPPAGTDAAKPQGLSGPRKGTADALQEIEGIGPVLERLCHEMGVFHFDQIAAWGASETAWMDRNLKGFKGRVSRDKWVAQAKLIGAEGIDAFRIRAKTNDY